MTNTAKKQRVAEEFFKLLKASKCSVFTLKSAAANCEVTEGELDLLFPSSVSSMIDFLFDLHLEELKGKIVFNQESITNSVKLAVMASLDLLMPYKREMIKIIKFLATSSHVLKLGKFSFKIADAIWKGVGVQDSGFAYYTKRASLAGIYSTTFIFFLLNRKREKTEKFLEVQIKALKKFGSIKKKFF